MASVLILLPPSSVPRAVLDMLRDWSALGLLQPYLSVESSEVDEELAKEQLVVAEVRDGIYCRIPLTDALADRSLEDLVRLVAISSHGELTSLVPVDVAGRLAQRLRASAALSPLHCHITRFGAGGWNPGAAWRGWHNLVFAPEDAVHPGNQATLLTAATPDEVFIAHAACDLASVAGIWRHAPEGPFDGVRPPIENDVVAVRAFMRSLDGYAAAEALRRRLHVMSTGLPRPRTGGTQSRHFTAPEVAAAQMCRGVFGKHASLLNVRYVSPEQPKVEKLPAMVVVRRFLAFLIAALRRAPGDLLDRKVVSASRRTARFLQDVIYGGDESRYQVVVRGITARETAASASDLVGSADELAQRVARFLQPAEHTHPDLAPLVEDLLAGALSLADAGERVAGVPLVVIDGVPGVVADPGAVVPQPGQPYRLPSRVSAFLGTAEVQACDARAQDQVAHWFASAGDDVETARAREGYDHWRSEARKTYAGQVSASIDQCLQQRSNQLTDYLERLSKLQSTSSDKERVVEEATGKARGLLGRGLAGVLILLGLLGSVLALALLPVALVLGLCAAVLCSWVGVVAVRLVHQERRLYALLNAREQAEADASVLAENLRLAANGLHLAGALYEQACLWLPLLGYFLHAPFGNVPQRPSPPRLDVRLPRAMGIARAVPESDSLASVSLELTPDVFCGGWLSPLWERFLKDAASRVKADGVELNGKPFFYGRDSSDSDSPLREWLRVVEREGVASGGGEVLWETVLGLLAARPDLSDRLLNRVDVAGRADAGDREMESSSKFIGELLGSLENVQEHDVSPLMLDESVRHYRYHKVADTAVGGNVSTQGVNGIRTLRPSQNNKGLDRFIVVVQASGPLPASMLRLGGSERQPKETSTELSARSAGNSVDEYLDRLQDF